MLFPIRILSVPLVIIAALTASLRQVTAPASFPAPALAGIAHVAFRVSDVPKSRDFYRTLGFEQAFEFADPAKPPVSYIKVNDRQFIELYGSAGESQPPGLLHVCYEATDIAAVRYEYLNRGLNAPEPRKARAGNLLLLFHDPDGQIIEYTEYLPGSLHFEDRGKHLGAHRISQHISGAAIPVRDLAAARDFYTHKLAFVAARNNGNRLRLPGDSGEFVELEEVSVGTKPRMLLAVKDLQSAANDLRGRGLTVESNPESASIADPDGTIIVFITASDELVR